MAQWFYVDNNQQRIGPMEAGVLVDALRHGQLNTGSMVWQEGMPAWQPLSMHFDAIGVPESLRTRKKEKGGNAAMWVVILLVVLGILIAIALPAYQDYTIRAKVSEGLNLSSTAKLATAEVFSATGKWPANDSEADYTGPSSNVVSEITIPSPQDVRITFGGSVPVISGETLMLRADVGPDGNVVWECNAAGSNKLDGPSGTLPPKYAPASCRP